MPSTLETVVKAAPAAILRQETLKPMTEIRAFSRLCRCWQSPSNWRAR